MTRCICKTLQDKRCKNSVYGLNYCWVHLKHKYHIHVLTIQRIWCGYKTRKKLNIIFKNLPIELQKKIIFYIRENFYIKKYHYNVVGKIVNSKIDKWNCNMISENAVNYIVKMNTVYYFANKYYLTLSIENMQKLQVYAEYLSILMGNNQHWMDNDILSVVNSLQEKIITYLYLNQYNTF